MSNGFGFSFPNDDDDNDDNNRRDNNAFGGFGFGASGGFGEVLNQFGQMLFGGAMNSPEGSPPVDYNLAKRIASQQIGSTKKISAEDANAVEKSVRLAELWLDEVTALPTASAAAQAWAPQQWLEATLPMWQRFTTPVAEHLGEAQMESMPQEARELMGPMLQIMQRISGANFGMQFGRALGELAKQALTGSDFGLPVAPTDTIALLPHNVQTMARELNIPGQEVLVYIAAREAARQRLFKHVPWLVERIVSSVEEYAIGLVIDTSRIEEATRSLNLESGDPQAIQEALSQLQGMDLSPRITSRNSAAASRLETLLSLVEGWVDVVVSAALDERIPSAQALSEAWARRRATGGSAEKAFSTAVGIELGAPKVPQAAELWRRATVAVGADQRDKAWEHPDLLPTAENLDNPAEFIDSLLDDAPDEGFEREFAKLEEMLHSGEEGEDEGGKPDAVD